MPALCYLFCAVESPPAELPDAGMPDGGAPRVLPLEASLALIAADVPAEIYATAPIEARLSDLDWVGQAGAAHHAVIDALAERGATVLPLRLFTIFSSDERALAAFRARTAALARAFDRVRGRQEWVLRIGTPDPARVSTAPAPARPATGAGFLQAKAGARREQAARAERTARDAEAACDALARLAEATNRRPVDPGGALLIDAAFLVAPPTVERMKQALTRAAERLLDDGCPVSLTGPWPPYSFAAMDAGNDE